MRNTVIGIIMAVLVSAAPVFGHGRAPLAGGVSVEIISDNGSVYRDFPASDRWKHETRVIKKYLEAKKGENYGVMIRNNSPERLGVVIAVDGRNIITGSRSDLRNNETMYIVNAYEHVRYDGWRTTDSEVHRFYFTEPADSYSIRTFADSSAMGVIAVAVYRQKDRSQPLYDMSRNEAAPSAPSMDSAARKKGKALAGESAGTGFGDPTYSPVVRVEFEPESAPVQKTLVKYEWRETLCKKGILDCGQERTNRLWDNDGYAPYPPGFPRS
ncbi:MAG: hypothetical protein M0R70_13630 [Nitrospirae bacterium]|nr:hypothetical protein [Nitrospirota bacterium]